MMIHEHLREQWSEVSTQYLPFTMQGKSMVYNLCSFEHELFLNLSSFEHLN